jgi:hypothetical protein
MELRLPANQIYRKVVLMFAINAFTFIAHLRLMLWFKENPYRTPFSYCLQKHSGLVSKKTFYYHSYSRQQQNAGRPPFFVLVTLLLPVT